VLASASPRRYALLEQAGFSVQVSVPGIEEIWPEGAAPMEAVQKIALDKARAVSPLFPERPVLAADTAVMLAHRVFGKPASRDAAREMLQALSGETHEVYTGIALACRGAYWTDGDSSRVTFRSFDDAELDLYLDEAEYMDKAGAYGIQDEGARLVSEYTGALDTIIGLPIQKVNSILEHVSGPRR
jgi:septum formation protein